MRQVTRFVENVNQDIRDGIIKNIDQSSQNITGLEEVQKIPNELEFAQNVLLINKSLEQNQEAKKEEKTEEEISISVIETANDDSGTFTNDV